MNRIEIFERIADGRLDKDSALKLLRNGDKETGSISRPTDPTGEIAAVIAESGAMNDIVLGDVAQTQVVDTKLYQSRALQVPEDGGNITSKIQSYLVRKLALELEVPESEIDIEANLMDLGLDSMKLIKLTEEFEGELGITIYPTLFFEYQTLAAVADYFSSEYAPAIETRFGTSKSSDDISLGATDGFLGERNPASRFVKSDVNTPELECADEDMFFYTYGWRKCVFKPIINIAKAVGVVAIHTTDRAGSKRLQVLINGLSVDCRSPFVLFGPEGEIHFGDVRTHSGGGETDFPRWIVNYTAETGIPVNKVVFFVSNTEGRGIQNIERSRATAYSALDFLREYSEGISLQLYFIVENGEYADAMHFALASLSETIRKEYPRVATCAVLMENSDRVDLSITELLDQKIDGSMVLRNVADCNCEWEERVLREYSAAELCPTLLRQRGIYLITGGAGGLGSLFAEYLARRYQARLLLSGRRQEDEQIRSLLERIRNLGGQAIYVSGDIGERAVIKELVDTAHIKLGSLHGVIHAAGVLCDGVIARKQREQFAAVVTPKIQGAIYLDELTAGDSLDFFATFSSLSAVNGNHGQSDYAYANGFLDGFADCREKLVELGQRAGRSLSIQWPLWAEGGMQLHTSLVKYMRQEMSIELLSTNSGLTAFETALLSSNQQLLVLRGDRKRIAKWLPKLDTNASRVEWQNQSVPSHELSKGSKVGPLVKGQQSGNDIAVIGFHGEFPGSPDPEAFWRNLVAGKDLISGSQERWSYSEGLAASLNIDLANLNTIEGGFIESVDTFDAEFFRTSAAEARLMDPQQRRFLQVAWAAIEDAGYDPLSLAGSSTGVFVGASTRDYQELAQALGVLALSGKLDATEYMLEIISPQASTGMALNNIPNRVSNFLDLKGPSELLDTACSSSLVALHRAVSALQQGECELAIVGGVNLLLSPANFWAFQRTGLLSANSRCRAFAKDANGYVRGEGVGAVVLKRRELAEMTGDNIQALIKGSAVNHGGRGQSLTAPNPAQQAAVIANALRHAGISPETIGYIEAHGTGTALGDPVEIRGLKHALAAEERSNHTEPTCGVGSVKSNIGHLEAAAGIAGLIKVLLCMRHHQLPKSLHIDEPNPYLGMDDSPLYLVRETVDWPRKHDKDGKLLPYRAGVSSFGFGGTNAHVILEEYPCQPPDEIPFEGPILLVLSANTAGQLREYARRLGDFLADTMLAERSVNMADVAYTLGVGRPRLMEKLAIVVQDVKQGIAALSAYANGDDDKNILTTGPGLSPKLLYAFSSSYGLEFLRGLYADGQLEVIGQLWLSGTSINWDLLDCSGRRISLPTHPFSRIRHWLPGGSQSQSSAATENEDKPLDSVASRAPPLTKSIRTPKRQMASNGSIKKFLNNEIARLLEIDPTELDPDRSLVDYGLDSIIGLQFFQVIKRQLDMPLQTENLLQYDTVKKLSDYLHSEVLKESKVALEPVVEIIELMNNGKNSTKRTYSEPIHYELSPGQSQSIARGNEEREWYLFQRLVFCGSEPIDIERLRELMIVSIKVCPQIHASLLKNEEILSTSQAKQEVVAIRQVDINGSQNLNNTGELLGEVETELAQLIDLEFGPFAGLVITTDNQRNQRVSLIWHHFHVDGLSAIWLSNFIIAAYWDNSIKIPEANFGSYTNYLSAVSRIDRAGLRVPSWIKENKFLVPRIAIFGEGHQQNILHADVNDEKIDASHVLQRGTSHLFERLGGALASTLLKTFTVNSLAVALRLHGRDLGEQGVFPDVIGNLACDVPVLVSGTDHLSVYQSFVSAYSDIEYSGVGYELLRRDNEVPNPWDIAGIRFNYQPIQDFDAVGELDQIVEHLKGDTKPHYLLDFSARYQGSKLILYVRYSVKHHKKAFIKSILKEWINVLKKFEENKSIESLTDSSSPQEIVSKVYEN